MSAGWPEMIWVTEDSLAGTDKRVELFLNGDGDILIGEGGSGTEIINVSEWGDDTNLYIEIEMDTNSGTGGTNCVRVFRGSGPGSTTETTLNSPPYDDWDADQGGAVAFNNIEWVVFQSKATGSDWWFDNITIEESDTGTSGW